jgi:hypothetical protein
MNPRISWSALALTLLVGTGSTAALAAKPGGGTACPIQDSTVFAVYGQTFKGGVGTSSRSWMTHFFDWWKAQDPGVNYLFLTAAEAQACANLATGYRSLKMWVQPGGDAYDQQLALGAAGKANINGFISAGGAYLGVCAGAYYATRDYYWEGKYYAHANLLGAYPVTMEGAISSIAPWPGYALTALSNGRNAIYYGGPTVGLQYTYDDLPQQEKLASFASIAGALPAVIVRGKILLTSVHLEAFENDGISGLSTADRTENYKYLATLINQVAGTGFKVPPYAGGKPACQDEVDNDGDGLTDLADPGCSGALDNDETDAPAGVVIADGFEDGLGAWSVTGAGGRWMESSIDPYTGSRHAYAVQPGVSTMTYIERAFSLPAGSKGELTYYRRLIGLDGPDEFVAQYYSYSDTSWHTLEATGSASANDAAYVRRQFILPNPATRLRFGCMAGAVSEKCEVDDVSLFAVQ